MSSSFVITFNLKCPYKGDAVPIIYGNCKELGNGEPTHGIEFIHEPNFIYNYQAKVRFSNDINKNSIWYSYCFRPSYGSIILENAPRRYLPPYQIPKNNQEQPKSFISTSISLYDTIDEVTPIGDFVIHFRVRCFTQFGQHLYVSGSCESLGNWDPRKAVQLFYEGNQDYWTGNVRIPLSNSPQTIEYKYFRTFVPKLKQTNTTNNENQNSQNNDARTNAYRDLYKDFYRSKNRNNLFFNRNSRSTTDIQKITQTPSENVKKDAEYDLSGIEWEPSDVRNHKIEIGPVISPSYLEIFDTFRWSDQTQEILTRSPFTDAINSRKNDRFQNKTEKKIDYLNTTKPGIVSVRFEALCPNILKHQDLYIVGSNEELGNWKFEKGFKMDDSNFPLFVATIDMKNEKMPKEIETTEKEPIKTDTKKDKSTTKLPKKEEEKRKYSFPFEYKFVIVGDGIKEHEIEVEDDSPLKPDELKKLEELKIKLQKESKEQINIDEEKLIKSMNRKKKIIQKRIEKIAIWESSPNRYCPGITSHILPSTFPSTLLINSWFVNPRPETIKRYGISIPLFSIRSSDSCGIGQYGDIKYLVDFCCRIGSTMIQFPMPIFDTNTSILGNVIDCFSESSSLSYLECLNIDKLSSVINESDENPLNIVSAFALHPIYISLFDIIPNMPKKMFEDIGKTKWELEKKSNINYKVVYAYKMKILQRIFKEVVLVDKKKSDVSSNEFDYSTFYQSKMGAMLMDDLYDEFVKKESFWLIPYALFCFFREKYKDSDFRKWPAEISTAFSSLKNNEKEKWLGIVNDLRKVAEEESKENDCQFDFSFFLWIQYVCNSQYKKAFKYAVNNNVALKGDFPSNVVFNSVDCWSFPFLFKRSTDQNEWRYQTVSIPEEPNIASKPIRPISNINNDFSSMFVFPSFDWSSIDQKTMKKEWWEMRINHFTELFHALKIDPALGLYRNWEIDSSKSVTSCLGHFTPVDPISKIDLDSRYLFDIERYTKPYIKRSFIEETIGKEKSQKVIDTFFDIETDSNDEEKLSFKKEYDNEKKLFNSFKQSSENVIDGIENDSLFEFLIRIIDDVLLIEDDEQPGKYFVRLNFFNQPLITLTKTKEKPILKPSLSFSELPENERNAMNDLYDYYTYMRQNQQWLQLSKQKLSLFNNDTSKNCPLICIDDNEIYRTSSLSYEIREEIEKQLHSSCILSLRIPRISRKKDRYGHFCVYDDPNTFDYFSICSPSVHNTSSLRCWWKDEGCKIFSSDDKSFNRNTHENFFKNCLLSASILSIFILQDLTGLLPFFRRQEPDEERITFPINENSFERMLIDSYESCEDSYRIRYRVPYNLSELIKNDELALLVKHISDECNRNYYEAK